MTQLFPYDNVVAGVLIVIVGFGFHWVGQHSTSSTRTPLRVGWTAANLTTGLLALLVAWSAS